MKEGVSTRAPSLGRGCRAQRGGVGFLLGGEAASSLPSPWGKSLCREKRHPRFAAFPIGEGGPRQRWIRVLSLMAYLRRSSPIFFIPLSPSNLRPFGAPPSIGRRERPREPLPLEGAAERSEAGLASFLGGEAASSLPSPFGKALCREKRYSRIAAFPIGEGGPRQRWIGCFRKRRT